MRIQLLDPFGVVRTSGRVARSTASAAEDAAIAALDAAIRSELAARAVRSIVEGPLGDVAARAAVRSGLIERIAGEMLEAGVAEHVADRVLAGPELDRLVSRVLEDQATERLVAQVLDSRLLDESVKRVLASEELWLVVDEIARSPSVTSAISQQGMGFADQVVEEVGVRTRRADAWLERAARRMLNRTSPATPAGGLMSFVAPQPPGLAEAAPAAGTAPVAVVGYVGLVTRTLAFAVDAAIINVVAVLTAAVIGLALSVLSLPSDLKDVLVVIGGGAYILWSIGYFVGFWSTTGQTPGARAFRFRVCTSAFGPLKPRRALLRFGAMVLAAIPLFAGFLPILFDSRRRGLQDMIARTVVVEAADVSAAAP